MNVHKWKLNSEYKPKLLQQSLLNPRIGSRFSCDFDYYLLLVIQK